jgi:hypothetical protein
MTIYGRFGDALTIVRRAVEADVQKFNGQKADDRDRQALANDQYFIVKYADNGKEDLYHIGYLKADNGAQEIMAAIEALPK